MAHNPFDLIDQRLQNIEGLLIDLKHSPKATTPQPEPETLLTVHQAAKFLSLSTATIYGLISKGELPVIKRSKRCYFSNIELLDYMKAGRKKTIAEIESEADNYLSSTKKRRVQNG